MNTARKIEKLDTLNQNSDLTAVATFLPGIILVQPRVHADKRGFFLESYVKEKYENIGIRENFVQDNHSFSTKGTLRGLHFQEGEGQAKLVRVTRGEVFDVAVDIRPNSPTFGNWIGIHLSDKNHKQIYIPVGFAHGFCVLSDEAEVLYKCSSNYCPEKEKGIMWNDQDIGIVWPIKKPVLSERDKNNSPFKDWVADRGINKR
jgi:dTDP-4-dehydrorhamnose 3,5-epimerase